jgi:hypothetical protein
MSKGHRKTNRPRLCSWGNHGAGISLEFSRDGQAGSLIKRKRPPQLLYQPVGWPSSLGRSPAPML